MRHARRLLFFISVLALLALTRPAHAQLNGENILGDFGVKSGSQPAPGFYATAFYYRYDTDTIKNAWGEKVTIDPSGQGEFGLNAFAPIVTYVTEKKILGGNWGMMAVIPVANGSIEAPGFFFSEEIDMGLADVYLMPFQIGWHAEKHDATAGLAMFLPTGRYEPGAIDNLGKGMWSYELSAGMTRYFDAEKTLSLATTAFYEIHSGKETTPAFSGVKVGQLLTLEGGAAKAILKGAGSIGVAYYAQWKVTRDEIDTALPDPFDPSPAKHRVFGFGPDVTIPIATKKKLIALVNARYLWESGARVKTEGNTLVVAATFPIPGIDIPPSE